MSPVWKIWHHKDEVYLAERQTGHVFKISLHKSGVWTMANTRESGKELKPGNRRMMKWSRPDATGGYVMGPNIVVPRMQDIDHIKVVWGPITKPVDWVPAPEVGTSVIIQVVFVEAGKTLADVMDGVVSEGDYLELPNGQRVYVLYRNQRLNKTDWQNINYLRGQTKPWLEANDRALCGFAVNHMQGGGEVPLVYVVKWGEKPNPLIGPR